MDRSANVCCIHMNLSRYRGLVTECVLFKKKVPGLSCSLGASSNSQLMKKVFT
jgi:hypothetical protein